MRLGNTIPIMFGLALASCGGGGGNPAVTPTGAGACGPTTLTGATTSHHLIDAAMLAGTLALETALVYKVYADFGDPRLPSQYKGDDTGVAEGTALQQVNACASVAGLSQATKDALWPFLIPPYFVGSWWDLANSGAVSEVTPTGVTLSRCKPWEAECPISADWVKVESPSSKTVVWYLKANETTDKPKADALFLELENVIWPKLTTLMGKAPKPDTFTYASEFDGRYDVILTDMQGKEGMTVVIGYTSCEAAATYSYLSRALDAAGLAAQAAHELMHAIQYNYDVAAFCVSDYPTLMESTATWATDYVYPTNNREQNYTEFYLNDTERSLDAAPRELFSYGAYLLPFYAAHYNGSSIVRDFWDATAGTKDELATFQAGFTKAGTSLAKEWPRFVNHNWNADPVAHYKTWDSVLAQVDAGATPHSQGVLALGIAQDGVKQLPAALPHLSANYHYIAFNDIETRSVLFVNGLTHKLSVQPEPILQSSEFQQYVLEGLPLADREGASVQALIKIDGQWLPDAVDLTHTPYTWFCRDSRAGRLDEMVLIFANGEHRPGAANYTTLKEKGLPSAVWASNIGCWQWTGDATFSDPTTGETLTLTNVLLENYATAVNAQYGGGAVPGLRPAGSALVPGEKMTVPAGPPFYLTSADVNWSVSHSDGDCTWTGSSNYTINQAFSLQVKNAFTASAWIPKGTQRRNVLFGGLLDLVPNDTRFQVNVSCTDQSWTEDWMPPDLFIDFSQNLAVTANGNTVQGDTSQYVIGGYVTAPFTFSAQREP